MDARFNVTGVPISLANWQGALESVIQQAESRQGGYVCFSNVHVCVMARHDKRLLEILSDSFRTFPDGKPLAWLGRYQYGEKVSQVAGPDFFPALLNLPGGREYRHYFYGSAPETLERLIGNIRQEYPGTVIAGYESPPFRQLSKQELQGALQRIREARPDFIWVGLGAPKQEYWMAEHWLDLRPALLFGVGAAFDFHAGNVVRAPAWMRKIGMEWLHRLLQEPGRLWQRYLVTNSAFIWYLMAGAFSGKHKSGK